MYRRYVVTGPKGKEMKRNELVQMERMWKCTSVSLYWAEKGRRVRLRPGALVLFH